MGPSTDHHACYHHCWATTALRLHTKANRITLNAATRGKTSVLYHGRDPKAKAHTYRQCEGMNAWDWRNMANVKGRFGLEENLGARDFLSLLDS